MGKILCAGTASEEYRVAEVQRARACAANYIGYIKASTYTSRRGKGSLHRAEPCVLIRRFNCGSYNRSGRANVAGTRQVSWLSPQLAIENWAKTSCACAQLLTDDEEAVERSALVLVPAECSVKVTSIVISPQRTPLLECDGTSLTNTRQLFA